MTTDAPVEQRDIPGFEGRYAVTSDGRVFSYFSSRFLRPGRKPSGHLSVVLGRKAGSRDIHVLVLTTFVGPPQQGMVGRHLDGDPAHNDLSNLEWSTYRVNGQDKKRHKGASTYILTHETAAELKRRLRKGERRKSLAAAFGVSISTVNEIARGRFHCDV